MGATWTADPTYDHAAGTAACTVIHEAPDLSCELVVIRTADSSVASSGLLTAISGNGIYPRSMLYALVEVELEALIARLELDATRFHAELDRVERELRAVDRASAGVTRNVRANSAGATQGIPGHNRRAP